MKKLLLILAIFSLSAVANPFSVSVGYETGGKFELKSGSSQITGNLSNVPYLALKYQLGNIDSFTFGSYLDYSFETSYDNSDIFKSSALSYGIYSKYLINKNIYILGSIGLNFINMDLDALDDATESFYAEEDEDEFFGEDGYDTIRSSHSINNSFNTLLGIGYNVNQSFSFEATYKATFYTLNQSLVLDDTELGGTIDFRLTSLLISGVYNF